MKRGFLIGCLLAASLLQAWALSPKREMRASWVATVWALDWPGTQVSGSGTARQTAIAKQQQELIDILDDLKAAGMNAAFFQVRGFSDAMYPSSYEPWSQYLTGTRGGDPGYDPLAFAVEEAHKRGLELHAWINPYRYSSSSGTYGTLSTDYPKTHPEWIMANPSKAYETILNPGEPAVVDRIVAIVSEIVSNYDVDGIVFDDYFYINGGTSDAADQTQYENYNPDGLSRGDWRRANVNTMVRKVYAAIQSLKPYVTFGISPAGVAATDAGVAAKYGVSPAPGSDWQYNSIYSDPLAWLSEGTVDYISPQIYWTIGSANDYAALCTWWSGVANKFGRHFYSSHSLSAMTAGGLPATMTASDEVIGIEALSGIEQAALSEEARAQGMQQRFYGTEIGAQVECNRADDLNGAPGSVFYATSKVVETAGFVSYLRNHVFTQNALTPVIGWKQTDLPSPVTNLTLSGGTLSWQTTQTNVRFAIYTAPTDSVEKAGCFGTSRYLTDVSYTTSYTPETALASGMTYAVSVLDRYGNESAPVVLGQAAASAEAAQLIYPANNAEALMPCMFTWTAVEGADAYVWQLAENRNFSPLICSRETVEPAFFSGLQADLEDGKTYYWRVATRKAGADVAWSETFCCTSKMFSILSPLNGATDVDATPVIRWDSIADKAEYLLEIAGGSGFKASDMAYTLTTPNARAAVPAQTLLSGKTYYARVTATTDDYSATTATTTFTVRAAEIPVPQIASPANGSVLEGNSLEVCWQQQNALGFRAELCTQSTFPPRSTTVLTTDAYTYCATFGNLAPGTYYVRVKALTNSGYTDPSDCITVTLQDPTALPATTAGGFECTLLRQQDAWVLNLSVETAAQASVSIYALTGACLLTEQAALPAGRSQLTLPAERLGNGMYMLKINLSNGRHKVMKFIKQ